MAWSTVLLTQNTNDPRIALLTVNRPQVLNALNNQVIRELDEAVDTVSAMEEVKVLILTGAGGRAFVAGADIGELQSLDAVSAYALARRGQTLFNKIETLDKIVIAAIDGFALGGGCELAMACDIRIATAKSKLGVPEVSLGTVPGYGGTQRLPRLVGLGRAKEICFIAKPIEAQRAYEIGLVNQIVSENSELIPACEKLAADMLKNSAFAINTAKKCMNEGMQMELHKAIQHEAALFSTTFAAPDTKEGIAAFLEKRPPKF